MDLVKDNDKRKNTDKNILSLFKDIQLNFVVIVQYIFMTSFVFLGFLSLYCKIFPFEFLKQSFVTL